MSAKISDQIKRDMTDRGFSSANIDWVVALQQLLDIEVKPIDLMDVACEHPLLLFQKPETLYDNVTRTAQLVGISRAAFVAAACKQPQLCTQKPETLVRKAVYVRAIAEALQSPTDDIVAFLKVVPNAALFSTRHLHLRYVLAKAVTPNLKFSTLVTMHAPKAEARATAHYAENPRVLQVLHAVGMLKTLPDDVEPIMRNRVRNAPTP